MGLDFCIEDKECKVKNFPHWSYGGFNTFREKIAHTLEINLQAYWDTIEKETRGIDYLLNHSDCDGDIKPIHCAECAVDLANIIKDWPNSFDKQQASLLIKCMEESARLNSPLIFC